MTTVAHARRADDQARLAGTKWLVLCAVATGTILLVHLPLLVLHFRRLWISDHYRYFPFVLAVILLLAWQRLRELESRSQHRRLRLGMLLMVVGLTGLLGALLLWSPWLAALAALFSGCGILYLIAPAETARRLVPVCLLWLLVLPLPFSGDQQLIATLQSVSSRAASYLLDFFKINHVLSGNVIEMPGKPFLVEEACSGIRSLFTLIALAAVLAIYCRRGIVHALLLITSGAAWAVLLNVLRIGAVILTYDLNGSDITSGWRHDLLGIIVIAVAALMLLSTDRLLLFFLEPIEPNRDDYEDDTPRLTNESLPDKKVAFSLLFFTFAFAGVGLLQIPLSPRFASASLGKPTPLDWAQSQSSLPDAIGSWNVVDFQTEQRPEDSIFGRYSSIWHYQSDPLQAQVSFDYPFVGWHPLENCYEGNGWVVESRETVDEQLNVSSDPGIVMIHLTRPTGESALLLFSEFDSQGQMLDPPGATTLSSVISSLHNRMSHQVARTGYGSRTYQIQVFAVGREELTKAETRRVADLFLQTRTIFLKNFRGGT